MDWIACPSSGEPLPLFVCILSPQFCAIYFFINPQWLEVNPTFVLLNLFLFLRLDLLGLYERIILTDIEFSDSQNVDQALWKNVFYQVIERFRQLLKDPACENLSDIRNMLLTLLDEVQS